MKEITVRVPDRFEYVVREAVKMLDFDGSSDDAVSVSVGMVARRNNGECPCAMFVIADINEPLRDTTELEDRQSSYMLGIMASMAAYGAGDRDGIEEYAHACARFMEKRGSHVSGYKSMDDYRRGSE